MFLALIAAVSLTAAPKVDQRLVGTWLAGNEPFITFAANGTGTMEEGKVKWSTDGANLTITDDTGDTERATFQVQGDTMTMTIGGIPVSLRRAGAGVAVKKQSALAAKAAKANAMSEDDADKEALAQAQAWLAQQGGQPGGQQQAAPQRGQQGAQQPAAAGNDQLSQLLVSSAWCSFSYNKISGTTSQTRVQYFRNGTWSAGGQRESYNSGPNGTAFGQSNSNNGGQWAVRNGQLWGSFGNGPLELVKPFSVTRNSNGYPILNSLGQEYSMCD
jgi:hypothetical protein